MRRTERFVSSCDMKRAFLGVIGGHICHTIHPCMDGWVGGNSLRFWPKFWLWYVLL